MSRYQDLKHQYRHLAPGDRMRAVWLEEQLDSHRNNLLDLQQLIADQELELFKLNQLNEQRNPYRDQMPRARCKDKSGVQVISEIVDYDGDTRTVVLVDLTNPLGIVVVPVDNIEMME